MQGSEPKGQCKTKATHWECQNKTSVRIQLSEGCNKQWEV